MTTAFPQLTAPRYDMYQAIHKGLRDFMADTLSRLGRVDVFDNDELASALAQLEALLSFCASHVQHENEFLHAAIQARKPDAALRTADDHQGHLHTINALWCESRALMAAPADQRSMPGLHLYRLVALFVAENLEHMHVEETVNNAELWAHYSDAELMDIHHRLLATIEPSAQLESMRWMVPALTPAQRAAMLGEMQAHAPAPAFNAVIETVRPHLDARDWAKLARALGLAQQPGLVAFA